MGDLNEKGLKGLIERPGRYRDGQGLFFKTLGLGRAYFVYRYRVGGKETETSLGPYPETTLEQARIKHAALRAMVLKKIDPVSQKRAAKAAQAVKSEAPTFGEAADAYLDRQEQRGQLGKNPKHRAQWRATLTSLPASFRDLSIDRIGSQQVFDALDPIWALKPETASRLRGRIAMVLDNARGPDDARPNPAAWSGWLKTKLGSPKKLGKIDRLTGKRVARGHHAVLPYDQLPAFWTRLADTPGVAARALQFTILTCARTSETLGMTLDEVSFPSATWVIPAARMKMGVAHRVPLSEAALRLIADQMAGRSKNPFVFPGRPRAPLSTMAMSMVLRRLGVEATVHGMRSAFRDWATEVDRLEYATAERCLAHVIGNSAAIAYDRSDRLELRRPVMERWASYVTSDAAKIIALKRRIRAPLKRA